MLKNSYRLFDLYSALNEKGVPMSRNPQICNSYGSFIC